MATKTAKQMTRAFRNMRALSTSAMKQNTTGISEIRECPFRDMVNTVNDVLTRKKTAISETTTENNIKSFDHVPGPKGLPVVGTLFDYFKKDGLRFSKMFDAYRQRAIEHGPIYKEKIATISTVVISDPNEYQKVIRAEGKYPIRREMEPMAHYRRKNGYELGLVNAQGEEWYQQRTVTSKKMLKMKEVLDFCQPMNDVANDFMEHLKSIRNDNQEISGLEKEIFKWAMESIGTFLFEERIGCFANPTPAKAHAFIDNLRGYFKKMQPLMYNVPVYKIFPTKLWKEFENYANTVMEIGRYFVDKKVKELQSVDSSRAKADDDEVAFLTYLLSQQSLTPEQALSTAVDLLMAATETTSNAILWTLYCLAKNPEVQETLYNETLAGINNEQINADNISKLSYVKAVLKESLRMYPITWATSRITQQDMEVCGYNIPAGTHVQANLYGMFRDDKLFPESDTFKPERWFRGNMDTQLQALSNLVWGHGARMCIGRRFAEQEMHILLTKIVQKFKLEYHHENIEPTLNTVMSPDRPVVLKFVPRTNA
ncbi:hypothetical protein ACJMK2_041508 [Sinanodonta woodiana]|uniref:Cytochrome P450 10 n=1 Tax=Sinanodonta woodiana TaxID=1069815 RepID=A0ABD3W4I4_SINWO